jgi:hypothetical protein
MMIKALQRKPKCPNIQKPSQTLGSNFLQSMVRPLAGNPPSYALLLPWMEDGTCSCCRMVWVEYCIPETKLGTREVGSFTTELSSRVCILKTLKIVVL